MLNSKGQDGTSRSDEIFADFQARNARSANLCRRLAYLYSLSELEADL